MENIYINSEYPTAMEIRNTNNIELNDVSFLGDLHDKDYLKMINCHHVTTRKIHPPIDIHLLDWKLLYEGLNEKD